MTVQFLYRYAGFEKITGALKCKDGNQPNHEVIASLSEIFYHRHYANGTEEYLSVYSHDPLENEKRDTSDERAKLVFPVILNKLSLKPNSGLLELPINEICDDVNCYGVEVLSYKEYGHPHYGLHFDENKKNDVESILLSINQFACICYPYKDYQIED